MRHTGRFVIVRGRDSGVHVGTLVSVRGQQVELRCSHRVWQWQGANTLNELALRGADTEAYTRISEASPGFVMIIDAIEVIETTAEAANNLSTPRWL